MQEIAPISIEEDKFSRFVIKNKSAFIFNSTGVTELKFSSDTPVNSCSFSLTLLEHSHTFPDIF